MEHLLLIPLQSVCAVGLTLGKVRQSSGTERRGDSLLTCSFSMAVFKASWTSTGTVSTVEPGRDTCHLQLLLGHDALTEPVALFQGGQCSWPRCDPIVTLSPNCTEVLPSPSMTWCCCSCLRAAICSRRLLHCSFWAASCCLMSSRSFSTWDMTDVKNTT